MAPPRDLQRLGLGGVLHLVRQTEDLHRFGELGELLHQIHYRHGEIARGVQHGEAQRGGQHHIAGADLASAPQLHRPGQHAGGDGEHGEGVKQPQPLQRAQAGALRLHFVFDLVRQTRLLPRRGAEGAHQSDIGDDVGEIAADAGGLAGEGLMQIAAAGGEPADDGAEG